MGDHFCLGKLLVKLGPSVLVSIAADISGTSIWPCVVGYRAGELIQNF